MFYSFFLIGHSLLLICRSLLLILITKKLRISLYAAWVLQSYPQPASIVFRST